MTDNTYHNRDPQRNRPQGPRSSMPGWLIALLVVIGAALVAGLIWAIQRDDDPDVIVTPPPAEEPAPDPDNDDPATVSRVQIAFLDIERESDGPERGCDLLVFEEREITPTVAPLGGALEHLFAIDQTTVEGWHNFMANTNDTLSFDRVEIENRTAHIYLTGELSGIVGVCDEPRARIQIEETALQFETVNEVQLYLNDEPTDLMPENS